jgi:hypothetical protein
MNQTRTEGSLTISWQNYEDPRSVQKYALIFSRYHNPKNGAQTPKFIYGSEALYAYLVEIGFEAEAARRWIRTVETDHAVSIPNVILDDRFLLAFDL